MKKNCFTLMLFFAVLLYSMPSYAGTWHKGTEARLVWECKPEDSYKPGNADRSNDNDWWYEAYGIWGYPKRAFAQGWVWIDEDKSGITDGVLNRYNFDYGFLKTNTEIEGKQVNEDGAWVIDGVVQTISQRRDVAGNTVWRGLTPGIYLDTTNQARVEISEDMYLCYYVGDDKTPLMEGKILPGKADESFKHMDYRIEVVKDSLVKGEMEKDRCYSIYVQSDYRYDTDRSTMVSGDFTIINSYPSGIFSRRGGDGARNSDFCYSGKINLKKQSSNSGEHWIEKTEGWQVVRENGTCLINEWYQSPESNLWYYLGADGYMLTNTITPDGFSVGLDGVWIQ